MAKGKGGLISLGGCGDRVRERESGMDAGGGREGESALWINEGGVKRGGQTD